MIIGTNYLAIEKNFCILTKIFKKIVKENYDFSKNLVRHRLQEYAYSKNEYTLNTIQNKKRGDFKSLNFLPKNFRSINFLYNSQSSINNISEMDFICDKDDFLANEYSGLVTIRRRKRRKFASEEERRVARILKNRRTAEESRQRRIHKMKTLENFVSISEEREKKFKEEIRLIGIQGAFHFVELLLLKKHNNW